MKITRITATWLHVPIPQERQFVTEFKRFDPAAVAKRAAEGK